MKRRQFTRADKGQAALLEEIRGMRSELRKMCGFLRTWELCGIPTERVDLLPPDAAAAVEENFGKLDRSAPVRFDAEQRWGRSHDKDRLGAVRVRVLSAMAGCRTTEEFEQLCSRIAGRSLESLEQEFPEPSPGESTSSVEALPSNLDLTGVRAT